MASIKLAALAAFLSTGAFAAPAAYQNTTTYACNPAHSYPNGASCISTAGTLSLVTKAPAATSATTYACNPAHSYPNGASCISTAGTLSLVTATPVATPATTYACNPAHQYPEGQKCISTNGVLTLLSPTTSAVPSTVYTTEVVTALTTYCPSSTQLVHNNKTYTVTSATTLVITDCPCTLTKSSVVPPTTAAPVSATTYACNPAHSYPEGVRCISTAGTLALVTPTPAATPATTYACNPAHQYPDGQKCISMNGGLTLLPPTTSASVVAPTAQAAMPAVVTVTDHSLPTVTVTVTENSCGAPSSVKPSASKSTETLTSTLKSTATISLSSHAPTTAQSSSSASATHYANTTLFTKTASSTTPAATACGTPINGQYACPSQCPLDLTNKAFEYPHLLTTNGKNGYFGQIDATHNVTATFDIPASLAGKTCNTYFAIPEKSMLVTSDYNLTNSASGKIVVSSEGKQTAAFVPKAGEKYLINSEKCAAGKAVSFEMIAEEGVALRWFQDWNACALGVFVVPQ